MIKQIQEINFPSYATLSSATVTLNDMGDKTITAQVKIDGSLAPDFSYDWEVKFKGERYIQPLRQPQASKGNDSICSLIDLTFYHKTIYDLKRYFFVEMASTGSGTAMADKYIADLNVNIEQFKVALQRVLDYYHEIGYFVEPITINLNPDWQYAQEPQYVQIQYTHIWDVVQKIYEIFGVRWSIEGREIKIGYPTEEVAHTFEYGFEGGLLKVERQVQSADIRNSLLGRGGEKNLPYRYFKDIDEKNPSFPADPDWIPELANIYFAELRGKTFRDYVKGWKAKHYGGTPMSEPTEAYTKGYTDTTFNPIEYVEDKDSIAKYGLLQGGLENQEDIYPTIQGVEVEGVGRVDEVVEVEQILIDEPTSEGQRNISLSSIDTPWIEQDSVHKKTTSYKLTCTSDPFIIPNGFKGTLKNVVPIATCSYQYSIRYWILGTQLSSPYSSVRYGHNLDAKILQARLYDVNTNENVSDITNLEDGKEYYYKAEVEVYGGFPKDEDTTHTNPITGGKGGEILTIADTITLHCKVSWQLETSNIPSVVIGNYEDGINHISGSMAINSGKESVVSINSESFTIPEGGATMIDIPINIIATDSKGNNISGTYEWEKSIKLVNTKTNELVSPINIPQGEYYARVSVNIKNNHTSQANYRIELLTSYIFLPIDYSDWQPTFDIWVKNIWDTSRNEGESAEAYAERVWSPILGDREGNEAKVVFTTGSLAGYSDWEFPIVDVVYDTDVTDAEWRLTLAKSDAEIEATGKWIPSTQQQAKAGDKFFFIGIDMPHQYVLWAEEAIDDFKRDTLLDTAHIKPTWVVQTDKVRLNQLQPNETEPLLDALKVGNSIRLADIRFIEGAYEKLYLQSVTYSWDAQTTMHPNVEVVLSDKVVTTTNPVAQLQGEVNALTKQVGSLSNIQQIIRAVGDKAYLRKDGIADTSNSETTFNKPIHSRDFQQGAVGGRGWGIRIENGKAVVEADTIIARYGLQVNNLVINQVASIAGTNIISAANMECSKVEMMDDAIRCYFNQRQGSISNHFALRDIAFSQVFSPDNVEVKYYKREVVGIGTNYIDLSNTNYDGDGAPQVGDTIVQMGNFDDTSRQGVIIIESNPLPSITQYQGVNSFTLPTPTTKISPNDNKFTGKVVIEAGSEGAENLGTFGKNNLLRNSGFNGDYLSKQLEKDSTLGGDSEMFSPSLVHWSVSNVVAQKSDVSESGAEVVFGQQGSILQQLLNNIVVGDTYVVSFRGKGASVGVHFAGNIETIELTDEYAYYTKTIVAQSNSNKSIMFSSSDATICELQLERGTIASAWGDSMWDNTSALARYQELEYLRSAMKDGKTEIDGGLILSRMIALFADSELQRMTAGINGSYVSDDTPAFWAGGSMDDAIATVNRFRSNPSNITDEEWVNLAKFVATHGGDVFMRGYIHALGGLFQGAVVNTKGKFALNTNGSGQLASGNISWDEDGRMKRFAPDSIVWTSISEYADNSTIEDYSKGAYIDLIYNATEALPQFTLIGPFSGFTIIIKGTPVASENEVSAILKGVFYLPGVDEPINAIAVDSVREGVTLKCLGYSSWQIEGDAKTWDVRNGVAYLSDYGYLGQIQIKVMDDNGNYVDKVAIVRNGIIVGLQTGIL